MCSKNNQEEAWRLPVHWSPNAEWLPSITVLQPPVRISRRMGYAALTRARPMGLTDDAAEVESRLQRLSLPRQGIQSARTILTKVNI